MGADTTVEPPASDAAAVFFDRMQVGLKGLSAKAYDLVPQAQTVGERDLEAGAGDGAGLSNAWSGMKALGTSNLQNWATKASVAGKGMAEQASKQLDKAKENLSKPSQFDLTKVFDANRMKDLGSSMSSSAKTALDTAKVKAVEAGSKTKEAASSAAAKTKSNVVSAAHASAAKIGEAKGSIEALTVSREKITQFVVLFLVGAIICSVSLNFLPIIVIAPQKFALLFAIGSGLMMASFSVVKGWKDFLDHLMQRSKLPFSAAYALGMVGVLWASLFHPPFAYIWIIVFSTMQIVGLAYFLLSYIPGGARALTFVGRACFQGCKKLTGS